jgi:hypothetical protein
MLNATKDEKRQMGEFLTKLARIDQNPDDAYLRQCVAELKVLGSDRASTQTFSLESLRAVLANYERVLTTDENARR